MLPFLFALIGIGILGVNVNVDASMCKTVSCPKISGKTISCDLCHTCLEQSSRFCFTADHKNCQCATTIPPTCGSGSLNHTFCYLLDDVSVPPPEIGHTENEVVTVVMPRFFQNSPFDGLTPSYLYLLALFPTSNETQCSSIGHIEAFPRNQEKCLLRVRILMPRIDYTGHDNYYYDDRSPLESQFSRVMFGDALNATFWAEVTIRKQITMANSSVSFVTVLKSERIDLEL